MRKIKEWNPTGMIYKGRPKNKWRGEELNDLKKLKYISSKTESLA